MSAGLVLITGVKGSGTGSTGAAEPPPLVKEAADDAREVRRPRTDEILAWPDLARSFVLGVLWAWLAGQAVDRPWLGAASRRAAGECACECVSVVWAYPAAGRPTGRAGGRAWQAHPHLSTAPLPGLLCQAASLRRQQRYHFLERT